MFAASSGLSSVPSPALSSVPVRAWSVPSTDGAVCPFAPPRRAPRVRGRLGRSGPGAERAQARWCRSAVVPVGGGAGRRWRRSAVAPGAGGAVSRGRPAARRPLLSAFDFPVPDFRVPLQWSSAPVEFGSSPVRLQPFRL
ncbi:hypothetical protein NKH77_26175 [Streptomyces sp. M19]